MIVTTNKSLARSLPALFAALVDISFTLSFQKSNYWAGNGKAVNEANPIGHLLAGIHYLGLPLICFIWLFTIPVAVRYLPKNVGEIFTLFCMIAHSWGAASWIENRIGFWSVLILFVVNSTIYIFAKNKSHG